MITIELAGGAQPLRSLIYTGLSTVHPGQLARVRRKMDNFNSVGLGPVTGDRSIVSMTGGD